MNNRNFTPQPSTRPARHELNNAGVYLIRCKSNNIGYIGSAKTLYTRYIQHFRFLHNGNHEQPELQETYNKYGIDNFEFTILETLPNITEAYDKNLLMCEGKWIVQMTSSINLLNNNSAGGEPILMLNGRMEPTHISRKVILENPNMIDEQIALWTSFKEAHAKTHRLPYCL